MKPKQTYQELEKKAEFFQTFADNSYDWEMFVDLAGEIKYISPSCELISGYTANEFIENPKLLTQIVHESDKEIVDNHFDRKLKHIANTISLAYRIITKKGNIKWIEHNCKEAFDKSNKNIGYISSNRDITERQNEQNKLVKTEKELSKVERRYRKMFENMKAGVAIYLPVENGNDFIFLDFNRAAEKITNTLQTKVIGKTLLSQFPNMNKTPFFKALQTVNETNKDLFLPAFYYKDAHREGWRENYIYKLSTGEIIAIFDDVTNLKKKNEELNLAKEKAEESDRLKSAFLANMSHEIRTPMNGILGFSNLLKEPNLTGEKKKEYIGIIEKSGARMLNIINDIVSISKIESGLMEVNMQESNINEHIEYIYAFFKPEIEAKGIQFSFNNSLPLKEAILKTDHEKVYAILTNLVKNAIKFTPEGSIEFGYILKKDTEPVEVEFYVKDTGIGVPADRHKAIFERFIQADITDKMARQGAGLGLAISKAYVEMLGGKIWIESEETKGSIFYFTLPYQIETVKENSTKNEILTHAEVPPAKKLKILIAEDDEISEMLMSIAVQKFVGEIISVRTGTEAVAACHNNPDINLVLMDIEMPEMDGYEATRQIRKFNKEVIIIAQTAYALEGEREKAITACCDDYIAKPIKADELEQMIIKYLNIQ
jgi:PAS domain S-box-containing protein